VWLTGILFVLVRGSFLNQRWLGFVDLDLLTILIAYLWIHYGQTGAGLFALGQGVMMDLFSGGMMGLFALLYLAVFLAIQMGSRFFHLQTFRGLMILILLAVLLRQIMLLGLLEFFSLPIHFSWRTYVSFGISALVSGFLAPPCFALLKRLDMFMGKNFSRQK
jgi:rod shape-determining protein MreD